MAFLKWLKKFCCWFSHYFHFFLCTFSSLLYIFYIFFINKSFFNFFFHFCFVFNKFSFFFLCYYFTKFFLLFTFILVRVSFFLNFIQDIQACELKWTQQPFFSSFLSFIFLLPSPVLKFFVTLLFAKFKFHIIYQV